MMHRWKIETYSNMYVRNYTEDYHDWYIGLGSSEYDMELTDKVNFTRFAILCAEDSDSGEDACAVVAARPGMGLG